MPRRAAAVLATPVVALSIVLGMLAGAGPASAHEERPAEFPNGTGHRPQFLGYDNPRQRVVCQAESARLVAALPDGAAQRRSERLLGSCRYHSIQDAIDSVRHRRTSVYVLPGTYHEAKYASAERSHYCSHLETASQDPLPVSQYIGSLSSPDPAAAEEAAEAGESNPIALSYPDQRRCAHNLNLIAIFGDETPRNDSIRCDSRFCGIQLVGTGRHPNDVIVDNRFQKLNAIRADRLGGFYLANMTFQQAEFNSIYVMETDGFVVDRVVARGNDEYGILAFASDHGLIEDTEAYYNGDSGIYPGSASDLNGDNAEFEPVRYAIEIRRSSSHDNALGYSGTAGNSVWAHHNEFFDNATGIATDSLFPGHPGLPQDHARWSHNDIHSNNSNYFAEYVDTGVCALPMEERGYIDGTVCPVIPTPVGTGVLIAGGNFDSTDHNWIYNNWRYGTMQFWVPAALRDDHDPAHQFDTSHHNHTHHNHMGVDPEGHEHPNGLDHWWDDQGVGNCWEDNHYGSAGRTDNFALDPPACADGGSVFVPGAPVKDAGFLTCSQYDRNDPTWRHPPGCTWFDSPPEPGSGPAVPAASAAAPASGWWWSVLTGGPSLSAGGPTSVRGTDATGVFRIADRTVRQVRYADGGTLRYTFRLANDGGLPLVLQGLAGEQPASRLFTYAGLRDRAGGTPIRIGPGDAAEVTLALRMGGCETLSARAGAFVTEVVLRVQRAGAGSEDVAVTLPEELHTGSPREASCPGSTATSRPPG